ncbi:MAG: proline dehydrogenase family protein [Sphingobacteriaceae bacterium]
MLYTDGDKGHRSKKNPLSFDDTEIAFKHATDFDLKRAYWLFKIINNNFLVKIGAPLTAFAIKIGLPIKSLIKGTIFKQFCGGETIEDCNATIRNLFEGHVGSILDYSIEGAEDEAAFDDTRDEIIRTIKKAATDEAIPFSVFKVTGVGNFAILEKHNAGALLNPEEKEALLRIQKRVENICQIGFNLQVRVMIDAEESWIQNTIDELALNMMRKYNGEKPIVYNTYQLYRHDQLASLQHDLNVCRQEGFLLGVKLVRGAYMEKERERAAQKGYPSPIHPNKMATDLAYDKAVRICIVNIKQIALVAGTHNETSCRLLTNLLDVNGIDHQDPHVYFAQLLGMSDHLSFNLANGNYRVAKYVPYGPVKAVLPYLFRRAAENTSISGQMGRELSLIIQERKRRRI